MKILITCSCGEILSDVDYGINRIGSRFLIEDVITCDKCGMEIKETTDYQCIKEGK